MTQFLGQPLTIIVTLLVAAAAILFWAVFDLRAKWTRLFGKNITHDTELLKELIQQLAEHGERLELVEPRIDLLEKIAKVSVQKVGFLRFNPFRDIGGDQSFSLALLDHENNGIIITGLYTREGTRVYAKEIGDGKSKQQLSGEEIKVLEEALNK